MADFDIDYVLENATVGEKVSLLSGGAFWDTQRLPRFNIPAIRFSDGPNGIRGNKFFGGTPSACLPCGTALAATWDRKLMHRAGALMGQECIAKGVHCCLGPTTNVQRSPLGGRGFESFSEDPYLSGKIAASSMAGIHSTGASSAMKHFVANDQEDERRAVNCIVSERALREIYLLPFQIALADTSPAAIMTAYNKVNGVHCSENKHLLQDILRNEWKVDIMTLSDIFGTYSVIEALEAGLDLELPGPPRWRTMVAEVSVSSRKLSIKTIDERLRVILKFVKRASQVKVAEKEGIRDLPEDRALNRELASNGVVLLKNEDDVLPLSKAKVKKIALIGPSMKQAYFSGGGSASLEPYYTTTPYQGIAASLGPDVEIEYEVGCYSHAFLPLLSASREEGQAPNSCTVKFFNKPETTTDRRPVDTVSISDSWFQLMDYTHPELDRLFWAEADTTVTAPSTGQFEFGLTVSGTGKLFVDGQLVIDNTHNQLPGTSFLGNGSAEVKGEIALVKGTCYKVHLEFASSVTSTVKKPGVVAFPGGGARIGCALKIDEEESIQKAVDLARRSDHVVVCAGLSGDWEAEGFDRPHMDLPGNSSRLIKEVLKANHNAVLVTQSGTPITMEPFASLAKAHLHAWYGGNEGGNGIADVLFGDVDASGRLPMTFPVRCEDNPAMLNSKSESGRILYGEDIYVGYRFYEKLKRGVQYPFGHGLSYAKTHFSDVTVTEDSISVTVSNVSTRKGAEVVQVYVAPPEMHQPDANIGRPIKELKGFEKVYLEPGERQRVIVPLDRFAGVFWDESLDCWVRAAGDYNVFIGKSSQDIVLRCVWNVPKTIRWNGI